MASTLEFSRSLYSPEAIQAAADAFADLAKLDVSAGDNEIRVSVSDVDPDVRDVLEDELCNYALHETIVRARG